MENESRINFSQFQIFGQNSIHLWFINSISSMNLMDIQRSCLSRLRIFSTVSTVRWPTVHHLSVILYCPEILWTTRKLMYGIVFCFHKPPVIAKVSENNAQFYREFDICSLLHRDFSTSITKILSVLYLNFILNKTTVRVISIQLQNLWTKLQRS